MGSTENLNATSKQTDIQRAPPMRGSYTRRATAQRQLGENEGRNRIRVTRVDGKRRKRCRPSIWINNQGLFDLFIYIYFHMYPGGFSRFFFFYFSRVASSVFITADGHKQIYRREEPVGEDFVFDSFHSVGTREELSRRRRLYIHTHTTDAGKTQL